MLSRRLCDTCVVVVVIVAVVVVIVVAVVSVAPSWRHSLMALNDS